jgi:hypothetical protein
LLSSEGVTFNETNSVEQTTLDLFPPLTFAELCSLQRDPPVTVQVRKQLRNSWYVKIHRSTGEYELCIPSFLENAPDPIKRALVAWAVLPKPRRGSHKEMLRHKRRTLEVQIRNYIDTHPAHSLRRRAPRQQWPTKGRKYDLREVFDSLNTHYFSGSLTSLLRWGKEGSRTSCQITRKGPDGIPWSVITIAGVYNLPDVPRFAIESILFHEMLHLHIPPRKGAKRTVIHGPDFKAAEHSFPHYAAWRAWERENLLRTVIRRRRKKGRGIFSWL